MIVAYVDDVGRCVAHGDGDGCQGMGSSTSSQLRSRTLMESIGQLGLYNGDVCKIGRNVC